MNKENPVPSIDNLLEIYKDFRDSDILEGVDVGIMLAFLYYIKKGNLEGKSFNEDYHANTEKDPLIERMKELEVMYNNKLQNGVETNKVQPKDGLYYNGKCLELEYEEIADLVAHYRDTGEEKHANLTRKKCSEAFGTIIPMTDY